MNNIDTELVTDLYFKRALDSFYDEAKNIVKKYDYSEQDMTRILIELMQLVEKEIKLSGLGKKFLVLSLLEKLINDLNEENKEELKVLVTNILPEIIDTLISIDKGKIVINKNRKDNSEFKFCCI
jgi:hypothetical protein